MSEEDKSPMIPLNKREEFAETPRGQGMLPGLGAGDEWGNFSPLSGQAK